MTPFRLQKAAYYVTRIPGRHLPEALFRPLRNRHINYLPANDPRVEERVHYYNKLSGLVSLPESASNLRRLQKERKTTYYFDLYEVARYFGREQKFCYVFGDVRDVPPFPAFVKSRPIDGDNANSVLLKLNKIRHFNFVRDPYRTEDKKNALVWRGKASSGQRLAFVEKFAGKPNFDVGRVHPEDQRPELYRPFLSIRQQLQYKFIFSLEGIDVASNLKWIMSSNSLCLMKKPLFETWFMEGKLLPNVHYVQVKDDFSDAEEKMEYYLSHPREMKEIIENAHRYIDQFRDPALERQISLLVMQKYFAHTQAAVAEQLGTAVRKVAAQAL